MPGATAFTMPTARQTTGSSLAIIATAALLLAGCGQDDNDAVTVPTAEGEVPATIGTASSTTTTSPTTTTTVPEGDRLSFTADFTNADGWEYRVDLDAPAPLISARKDVSSAPPGQAQLAVTVSDPLPEDATSSTTQNAGRPDGPPGGLIVSYVWTGLSGAITLSGSSRCTSNNYRNPGPPEWETPLVCSLHAEDEGLPQPAISESLVDEIVAAIDGQEPIILLESDFTGDCGVAMAVLPDGSVIDVSRDSDTACAMTIKMRGP